MLNIKYIRFEKLSNNFVMPHLVLVGSPDPADIFPEMNDCMFMPDSEDEVEFGYDSETGVVIHEYMDKGFGEYSRRKHLLSNCIISESLDVDGIIDITIDTYIAGITVNAFANILTEFGADKHYGFYNATAKFVGPEASIPSCAIMGRKDRARVLFMRCPKCREIMDMAAISDNKHIMKHNQCLACAMDDFAEKFRQGDTTAINSQLGEVIVKAASAKAKKQLDIFIPYYTTQAILNLIDEALDKGDQKEFMRLTNMLRKYNN